jgi:hypothetical protein
LAASGFCGSAGYPCRSVWRATSRVYPLIASMEARHAGFYRSGETLVKVYDEGDDVRVSYGTGEFWFSMWSNNRLAAIHRAIVETCRRIDAICDESLIVFTIQ